MPDAATRAKLNAAITLDRAKQVLVDLVRVPSPQTELLEAEPLLRDFIDKAVEPRLKPLGFAAIRRDGMGNLIAEQGADATGRSLMLITNAMNQPQATMTNAYAGDVIDARPHGLPGEAGLSHATRTEEHDQPLASQDQPAQMGDLQRATEETVPRRGEVPAWNDHRRADAGRRRRISRG